MSEQSFMKALFFGIIADDLIFPFPRPMRSEREALPRLLDQLRRRWEPALKGGPQENCLTTAVELGLSELGLFGLCVPREYAGLGATLTTEARVFQELGALDASLSLGLFWHEAMVARSLVQFGTEQQQRAYLPELASARKIGAFAFAERTAGTDPSHLRTIARHDQASGFRVSGTKYWVSNASNASVFLVGARTTEPIEAQKPRICTLLVDRGPGVVCGPEMGSAALPGVSLAQVEFRDVEVPEHQVLGQIGKGYKVVAAAFGEARLMLAATMLGQSTALLNHSLRCMAQRRSFGRTIGQFPALKLRTTRMLVDCFALESMVYLTAGLIDRGVEDCSLEATITRVASADVLWRVTTHAMHIEASSTVKRGQPVQRALRDAPAQFFLDGTQETLRCFIALVGMRGLAERSGAEVREPIKGFGVLRDFAIRNFALRKVRAAFRSEKATGAHALLRPETELFERMAEALADAVERVVKEQGAELYERQFTLCRVADIAIDLYALISCIARTSREIERSGETGAQRMLDLTRMFAHQAEKRLERNLRELFENTDDLRGVLSDRAHADGCYPFDIV